jgi:predicted peptidase
MTITRIILGAFVLLMAACSSPAPTDPVAPEKPAGSNTGKPPVTPPKDTVTAPQQQTGVTFRKVNNAKSITDYVLQLPASYNTDKNKKWPVIFFLHGVGERGSDLNRVKRAGLAAKAAKDPNFPFIVVSPQCKADLVWDNPSLDVLYADVLKQFNIDPKRMYLTGLSMGGFGAWGWANISPDKFAAVVPICGGGNVAGACRLKDIPIWAFHNADDRTVPVNASREMVNAIKNCGGKLIKYTENPTGGHDAWTKAYNDPALFTWLSAQSLK